MIEGREDSGRISKALRQRSALIGLRRNLRDLRGPSFDIPVGWVVGAVIHDERKATGPANNSSGFPTADELFSELAGRGVESLSTAYRQVPDVVRVDLV